MLIDLFILKEVNFSCTFITLLQIKVVGILCINLNWYMVCQQLLVILGGS